MTKDEIMAFDFTFMNITNALTELQAIKDSEPSEAIKCLNKIEGFMRYYEVNDTYKDELTTIKQALLKQLSGSQYTNIYIDEAVKPSEALRCLEELRSNLGVIYDDTLNAIEQALLKAQELEKENAELNQHIKRWHDLLLKTGINSKGTVADEIENYWQIKVEAKNEK